MNKREREHRFFELFLQSRPDLNSGVVSQHDPPAPDIGYAFGGSLIGVELTELHGRESIRRDEGEEDAILRRAQAICEHSGGPRVWVSACWSDGLAADKRLREGRARDIAELISKHIPPPGQWVGLGAEPEGEHLDFPLFQALWIERVVEYAPGENSWVSEHSWWQARADEGFVQKHIDRKQGRRHLYPSQFSSAWLVMTVRGSRPSSGFEFTRTALDSTYRSEFDRVFLFEVIRGATHELKLAAA